MTQNAPPRVPTPRLKVPPTSSTSTHAEPVTVTAFGSRLPAPPSRSQTPAAASDAGASNAARRAGRPVSSDFLSDRATSLLIRRVLCPQQDRGRATPAPIDELLPPLTSRNDVDLQLYAIIAIIIRDFVQNWYNKITPDETFVAEVVQIIAHCTRALEQRLRKVDLEALVFDELPDLLDKHVQVYRAAHKTSIRPPIEANPHEVYHSLCPLPLLSPVPRPDRPTTVVEQAENEAAHRQLLVQGVLAVLLPTEDLENGPLTALVGQIFSEMIIGGVIAKKASEPWMILEGLSILAGVIQRRRSEISDAKESSQVPMVKARRAFSIQGLFWAVVQWSFALVTVARLFITTVAMSRSLPARADHSLSEKEKLTRHTADLQSQNQNPMGFAEEPVKIPIMTFRLWPTISNLLEMDLRMPWLCGSLSMLQWIAITGPGRIAGVDGVIDRLLSHAIHKHVLDPAQLPHLLRSLRGALFPNNAMGSPTLVAPTSDEELLALRRRCANALWALVPKGVGRLYFGGGGAWQLWSRSRSSSSTTASTTTTTPPRTGPKNGHEEQAQRLQAREGRYFDDSDVDRRSAPVSNKNSDMTSAEEAAGHPGGGQQQQQEAHILSEIENGILDVFSDAYCNKHLMYSVLELVIVRLVPELEDKGIVDLWAERLS